MHDPSSPKDSAPPSDSAPEPIPGPGVSFWNPSGWLEDLRLAFAFLTRLPIPGRMAARPLAVAVRCFPLVGLVVGLVGGAVYALGLKLDLPMLGAALFAIAATGLLTGALHEDGLADSADGLAGGQDRDRRLAIMSDSHIGSYGVLALIVSVMARASLLAGLPAAHGVAALIGAHALARAAMALVMARGTAAKSSGLGAAAGKPAEGGALVALAIAAIIAWIALGPVVAAIALVAILAIAWAMARLGKRLIGGYTGDILGAVEQLSEIAALAVAVAAF
jgi:adenosylcobinamide-GDP ribazoletransferase